jgi:hypothetical protein
LLAAAGFAALGAVLALQWHSIPKHLALPDVHPSVMLVDKPGALLGATNILVCLGLLAAAPALQWELWVVTLVCALLHALYCFIAYVGCKGRWCKVPAAPEPAPGTAGEQQESVSSAGCVESGAAAAATSEDREAAEQQQAAAGVELVQQQQQHFVAPAASEEGLHQRHPQHPQQHQELEGCRWRASLDAVDGTGTEGPGASCLNATEQPFVLSRGASRVQLLSAEQHAACSDAPAAAVFEHSGDGFCAASCEDGRGGKATGAAPVATAAAAALPGSGPGLRPPPAPTFWHAVVVLPWEVVPFVLGMFCVVEGLNATGWVDSLAAWLAAGLGGNVWGALFGIGLLSLLLANIINNQVGGERGGRSVTRACMLAGGVLSPVCRGGTG